MTGYTKLFNSILTSTIWCQDSDTRIVWITMLAMSNAQGLVEVTIPGLAKQAAVPVDKVRDALVLLEGPDPDSRTPDNEGRRIAKVDGGWQVLNYQKYREQRDEDKKRDYMRQYMRSYRKNSVKQAVNFTQSNAVNFTDSNSDVNAVSPNISSFVRQEKLNVSRNRSQLAQAEAEAEVKDHTNTNTIQTVNHVNFKSQELKNHPRRCLMPDCQGQQRTGLPGHAALFCSEACYDRAKRIDPANIK